MCVCLSKFKFSTISHSASVAVTRFVVYVVGLLVTIFSLNILIKKIANDVWMKRHHWRILSGKFKLVFVVAGLCPNMDLACHFPWGSTRFVDECPQSERSVRHGRTKIDWDGRRGEILGFSVAHQTLQVMCATFNTCSFLLTRHGVNERSFVFCFFLNTL